MKLYIEVNYALMQLRIVQVKLHGHKLLHVVCFLSKETHTLSLTVLFFQTQKPRFPGSRI